MDYNKYYSNLPYPPDYYKNNKMPGEENGPIYGLWEDYVEWYKKRG